MSWGAVHWIARRIIRSYAMHKTGAFRSSCLTSLGHTISIRSWRANKKEAAMLLIGCDVFRQANRGRQFISVRIWPGAKKTRALSVQLGQ